MRVSTVVAVLSLAAGVAPSVALAHRAMKFGRGAVRPLPIPPKPLPDLPAEATLDSAPAKPPPLNPVVKSVLGEMTKSVVGVGVATGVIAASNGLVGQPHSRRELLERFDRLIERELLITALDELD